MLNNMEYQTLSNLRQHNETFIQTPLTVVVVLLEEFTMVPGAERCRCRCVFADTTGLMRGFCYKEPEFQQGDTVKLYNYHSEDQRIIFHDTSSVLSVKRGHSMNLPPSYKEDAKKMMDLTVTPQIKIRHIQEIEPTTKVTFSGRIKQIDGPMTLMTDHGERELTELICTDSTGSVYLGLWEYCSALNFEVGQRILVKDARTRDNDYHQEITVSINHPDEIEVLT